jgi:hypothetical protein
MASASRNAEHGERVLVGEGVIAGVVGAERFVGAQHGVGKRVIDHQRRRRIERHDRPYADEKDLL